MLHVVDHELRLGRLVHEPDHVGQVPRAVGVGAERPPTTTSPPNAPPELCGTSLLTVRSSVDLPDPESPTTSTMVPGSTARSIGPSRTGPSG
ncbi:MAG: hypothetical protein R2746_02180 [Acidimicrobiales bacterium]